MQQLITDEIFDTLAWRVQNTTAEEETFGTVGDPDAGYGLVMGRYTENIEPISDIKKTDTDTDVGIWNTENTEYRQLYSSLFTNER